MAPRPVLLVLALLLAGCGADEESAAPPPPPATDLLVRVDPDGRGPEQPRELRVRCAEGDRSRPCAAAAELTPADFAPADRKAACTQIFGGADTARVSGTLRGEPVSARFSRANGCEIARWDAVAPLLRLAR